MDNFDAYSHINVRLNPDGTVTRLLNFPAAETNDDPDSGEAVLSKDVIINAEKDIKIRLYLPLEHISKTNRIPIVIYFYGCSWLMFSADNPALHADRKWTAESIPALLILVLYRLSPDTRLPGQYEDAADSIMWLKSQALDPDGEKWVRDYGDFSRCFLSGSDNGGNIVFNTALRLVGTDLNPVKIVGLMMNQPFFGGKQRTESEIRFATDQIIPLPALDLIWELTLPKGTNRDHRYCNPMLEGPHQEKIKFLPPCLVLGYGMDPLIDRYQLFVEMLVKHGVAVEAHFHEVGFHRIEIIDSRRKVEMMTIVRMFVSSKLDSEDADALPHQQEDRTSASENENARPHQDQTITNSKVLEE